MTIDEDKAGNLADDEKGFARRVWRSFIYSGIGNSGGRLFALVGYVIGFTLITSSEFGAANLALSVLFIVRASTEAGLGVALVQVKKASRRQIDTLFWTSLLVTWGGYLVVYFAIAPLLGYYYEDFSDATSLVRGICLSVALYTFYFIPRAFMERELHLGRLMIIDNISYVVATVVLFLSARAGEGAFSFVYFEVSQRGTQALLSMLVRPYAPRLVFKFAEVRSMFRFAAYATGSRLLYNFYNKADFFIVGKVFGESALGVYSAGWFIVSEPVKGLAMAINQVAYPAFARLQDDLVRLRKYFFTINRVSMSITGSVLGLIVVYAAPTLRAIEQIKPEYRLAIPYIWLFGIMGIFKTIAPLVPQLLNAVGKARLSFLYSLTCAIVLPIGFLIGSQFSVRGVVLAWVIGYPLVVMVLYYFGAMALELRPMQMLRVFAGLRVAAPIFAVELALYFLLHDVLSVGDGLTAAIGAPTSLLCAVLVTLRVERDNLRNLRKGAKPATEADKATD